MTNLNVLDENEANGSRRTGRDFAKQSPLTAQGLGESQRKSTIRQSTVVTLEKAIEQQCKTRRNEDFVVSHDGKIAYLVEWHDSKRGRKAGHTMTKWSNVSGDTLTWAKKLPVVLL